MNPPASTRPPVTVEVHLAPDALESALSDEVRAGLTSTPRAIPPKWLYDERGSELFEEITLTPEYYPTNREAEIFETYAADIAAQSGADTMVELGSGSSRKTRLLLEAFQARGNFVRFVPFDVSEDFLRSSAETIAADFNDLEIHAVVGDFERHLGLLPKAGCRMFAFLGSTIGNLEPPARARFLAELADAMNPGDTLLLGTDLVKDVDRLEAAYNDAAGVTAQFSLNVLNVINRELDADFNLDAFTHVARWNPDEEWIEIFLRSEADQTVRVEALDLTVDFAADELLGIEVSTKFRPEKIATELGAVGLTIEQIFTDAAGDFAVTLARKA